jgi:hypothetical protein
MTLTFTSSDFRNQFTTLGTGPFTVTVKFTDVTDLRVIRTSAAGADTTLTNVTDYSVTPTASGTGSGYTGGSLTLVSGLTAGQRLTVLLDKPFEQPQDYRNSTDFQADTLEKGLDRLTVLAAQIKEQADRSLRPSASSTISDATIGSITANYIVAVNSLGTGFTTTAPIASLSGALTPTLNNTIVGNGTDWVSTTPSAARTALGLGTIATQNAASVSITGGSITGITDLAVADGGTGASDAAGARTNLGLVIGTNVQAYDATLASLASYNTNGLLTQTASDTFTGRTISASSGLSVTNGDGVSGNPTVGYAISSLTEEVAPVGSTDFTLVDRAGTVKKLKLDNIPSSAAPTNASYVTLASNASLTAERVLTAGSGITLTDGGANSTATLALNINGLTTDASPDSSTDYIMTYDASAGTNKKVLLSNISGTAGNWTRVSSTTISGSPSTVTFTSGLTSTYDVYMLVGSNVTGSTATADIILNYSENSGSSWITTSMAANLIHTTSANTTTTNANSTPTLITAGAASKIGFILQVANPSASGGKVPYQCMAAGSDGTNGRQFRLGGLINNSAAVNGLRFSLSAGTFSTGIITLYGLKYT